MIQGSNVEMYPAHFIATMSTSVQKLKMTCAIPALNALIQLVPMNVKTSTNV